MEKMKNMIVIKNINSNLVEEAIIVFKENVKIKEKQIINNIKTTQATNFKENYCLKEAEEIISDYVEKIEKNNTESNLKIKLTAMKILNIILVLGLLVSIIF